MAKAQNTESKEEKVLLTPEQELSETQRLIIEGLAVITNKLENQQSVIKKSLSSLEVAEGFLRRSGDTFERNSSALREEIKEVRKAQKELTEKIGFIDQTVCNVLLAIRQNEYLQAWYPEQQGNKEMKVVGPYPNR